MNKISTYIGYYFENNRESLFYELDDDTYHDLKENKRAASSEIKKLIPFSSVIDCHIPTKRNLIRCYMK